MSHEPHYHEFSWYHIHYLHMFHRKECLPCKNVPNKKSLTGMSISLPVSLPHFYDVLHTPFHTHLSCFFQLYNWKCRKIFFWRYCGNVEGKLTHHQHDTPADLNLHTPTQSTFRFRFPPTFLQCLEYLLAYEWGMSCVWMNHVAHVNESCLAYEYVMAHIWMGHVTRMNDSCLAYK